MGLRTHPGAVGTILAHQYGWDEFFLFVVPIVLALAGVRYAEKRATRQDGDATVDAEEGPR